MSYFLPKGKAFLVSKLETLSIKEVLTWALISAGVRSPFSSRIAHAPVPLSFSQSAILWQASGGAAWASAARLSFRDRERTSGSPPASFLFPMSKFHRCQLLPGSRKLFSAPSVHWEHCALLGPQLAVPQSGNCPFGEVNLTWGSPCDYPCS